MGRKIDGLSDNIETHINRSWSIEPTGVTNLITTSTIHIVPGNGLETNSLIWYPSKLVMGVVQANKLSVISEGTAQGSCSHITNEKNLRGMD